MRQRWLISWGWKRERKQLGSRRPRLPRICPLFGRCRKARSSGNGSALVVACGDQGAVSQIEETRKYAFRSSSSILWARSPASWGAKEAISISFRSAVSTRCFRCLRARPIWPSLLSKSITGSVILPFACYASRTQWGVMPTARTGQPPLRPASRR